MRDHPWLGFDRAKVQAIVLEMIRGGGDPLLWRDGRCRELGTHPLLRVSCEPLIAFRQLELVLLGGRIGQLIGCQSGPFGAAAPGLGIAQRPQRAQIAGRDVVLRCVMLRGDLNSWHSVLTLSPNTTSRGRHPFLERGYPGIEFGDGVGNNIFELIELLPDTRDLLTKLVDVVIGDHVEAPWALPLQANHQRISPTINGLASYWFHFHPRVQTFSRQSKVEQRLRRPSESSLHRIRRNSIFAIAVAFGAQVNGLRGEPATA
jgi:hypothetical protein